MPASRKTTDVARRERSYGVGMQTLSQTIPTDAQIRTLQRQRARLERHLECCRAAVAECTSPNPPLGRELDDAHASL
ncbi:MAG: hypothetical protein QOH83_2323, partial [Solirubrobacteraceae bacterium]|nr:hypothetical protein [Solirubrobacteraceae bacterium]